MRVLALCSYPVEAAATRFRLEQFVEPLRRHGIDLTLRPFLNSRQFRDLYSGGGVAKKALGMIRSLLQRAAGTAEARKYDVLLVQREAMLFGPAFFERLYRWAGGLPLVLDLDDATYIPYVSPRYGRAGSLLKFFGKTDSLIRQAGIVICGNRFIAEYVESKGALSVVVPTVVDTEIFSPSARNNDVPVVGWVGTHSTFPLLESLFPVLERLAKDHRFRLRIVGSGTTDINIDGVEVENVSWSLEREVADFQALDIGLYPIKVTSSANEQWLLGKSGFKAIQYLAVGIPFVMTPVGVCAEIGEPGVTHLHATGDEDWYNSLSRLIRDAELRRAFGVEGRKYSLEHYTVSAQASILAETLLRVGRT